LSRLISGEQQSRTTFLEGREDDETISRTSTFTLNSKYLFKVKAKLDSKFFRFPPTRLLLGLYDYRFKHLAMMEKDCDKNIASTPVGLAQLLGIEESESRTTPFQEGKDDEDISTVHASSNINHPPSNIKDTNLGPLTRSRAKKLLEQVNSFLTDYNFNISKNVILPKCSTLMLLRYAQEDMGDTVL
jgi:hypothetical protein